VSVGSISTFKAAVVFVEKKLIFVSVEVFNNLIIFKEKLL